MKTGFPFNLRRFGFVSVIQSWMFDTKRCRFAHFPLIIHLFFVCCGAEALNAGSIRTQPYNGITLITRTECVPRPVRMNLALIDLSAPGIRFKLSPPGGPLDTVRQTTLEFLQQENAQLAVNVHFFVPFPSTKKSANLVGLAASEGVVYSPFEPQPVARGEANQGFAILPCAPALNIDANNYPTIVHRSFSHRDGWHVRESVTLWNTVSGSAQILTNGHMTIPRYTRSRHPSGSVNGFSQQDSRYPTLTNRRKNMPSKARLRHRLLALHGFSQRNSWYSIPNARTAIGVTRDRRTLVLFTVDGAQGSKGMTPREVAELLRRDYAVWDVLNLDGGGSTTMAGENPLTGEPQLLNIPGDAGFARSVGSSLAVFATRAD